MVRCVITELLNSGAAFFKCENHTFVQFFLICAFLLKLKKIHVQRPIQTQITL